MTLVRRAVEELSDSHPMTREHLVALHRSLVPDSPEHHGIRVIQNWMGGPRTIRWMPTSCPPHQPVLSHH